MQTPEEFLESNGLATATLDRAALIAAFQKEMEAGLAGEPSSLKMIPTYTSPYGEITKDVPVTVLDAGGTNLRAGRVRFDEAGKPVTEALQKRRMPGTLGRDTSAEEMFRAFAELALTVALDADRACIAFSFPCECLPNGDGRIISMGKESRVTGAEGKLVCEGIETAMRALGASGTRRWRLINDTVGSMLGGMASCDRSRYADFIGFILGTGTNACCHVKACDVTKSPETVAMGGETLVNLESGCFGRALRGTADIAVDEASGLPGDHPAEKMISGAYYRLLLRETLLLAAKEGFLSAKGGENIAALSVTSAMVHAFCLDPMGGNAVAEALETEKDRRFASEINTMLLERAARIAAACLCAILRERGFGAGTLTGICADGTMLKLNPVLRPRMEALIAEFTKRHGLGGAEFLFAGDATLLGCAWAALA